MNFFVHFFYASVQYFPKNQLQLSIILGIVLQSPVDLCQTQTAGNSTEK